MTRRLRQPDQRSCGAAVLVVAEALRSDRYARGLIVGGPERFIHEVLAMHRRITGPVDVRLRMQVPWHRMIGTPPWAVARQLSGRSGLTHHVRVVWPWSRRRRWHQVVGAVRSGHPVPIFLGSPALPRHVVLATEADQRRAETLTIYDPAIGRPVQMSAEEFLAADVVHSWPVPWFIVLPETPTPRPRERRSPA